MRELLIATTNKGKLAEIESVLYGSDFSIVTLSDLSVTTDLEEPASTLEGNAIIKAIMYGNRTEKLTLADDTGLFVDALDGRPGVKTARYAPSVEGRIDKLLGALKDIPDEKRTAIFRTVVALYDPATGKIRTCEGVCKGMITRERRGEHNFGLGPIFEVEGTNKTLSEMRMEEVHSVNHRSKAIQKAREILLAEFV